MTHITELPSQSMFNSEGSRFINKYNTTIEGTVYLTAINDLPLSVQRKSSEAIRTKTDCTLQDPDWSALVDHL